MSFIKLPILYFKPKNIKKLQIAFIFFAVSPLWVEQFWICYGNSQQMLNQHLAALYAYAMSVIIHPANPIPHLFAKDDLLVAIP